MHDTEYTANAAFQANVEERARWAQVLGTSGKRNQAKPARVSFLARIVALFN